MSVCLQNKIRTKLEQMDIIIKKAAARDIVSLTEVAREWLLTWEEVGGCHYYAQVNCAEREI